MHPHLKMNNEFHIFVDEVLRGIASDTLRTEIREKWLSVVRDRCASTNDGLDTEESFDTVNILNCEVQKDQAKEHGARRLKLRHVHGLIGGEWRIFHTLTAVVRED